MGTAIDGRALAKAILGEVRRDLAGLRLRRPPTLGVVLANDNPASLAFVARKEAACREVGFVCHVFHQSRSGGMVAGAFVAHCLERMSGPEYDGVIVQLPVDGCRDPAVLFDLVPPHKDVDCFHPLNVGLLSQGRTKFLPCTPAGIIELLTRSGVEIEGKYFTIVNNSNIVGKPLAMMLTNLGATVVLCHRLSDSLHVQELCIQSDVVVVGVGTPGFLTPRYLGVGQVVVDVGITRVGDKVVGDVDPSCYDKCDSYTPVPGGVGPLTCAVLMRNVLTAARMRLRR